MMPEIEEANCLSKRIEEAINKYGDFELNKESTEVIKSDIESSQSIKTEDMPLYDKKDDKFFPSNYSHEKMMEQDLIHIIQILRGTRKNKQIKVEELFEIDNRNKPVKNSRQKYNENKMKNYGEDRFSFSAGISTKKTIPLSSKSHPNSRIRRDDSSCNSIKNKRRNTKWSKENFQKSQTESCLNKKSKIRPYMLDATSRRQIRDFDDYLNKKTYLHSRKQIPSSFNTRKLSDIRNKIPFEVKFLAPSFTRTSDLSVPTTFDTEDSLSSSEVREKFQTEPKVENTSFTKATEIEEDLDDREREKYANFEEYPNLIAKMRKKSKTPTIFDKLKGDERDLPEIYSRFVRKSKGSSKNNSDTVEFDENKDLYITGELLEDKPPINEKLLELIDRNPYQFEKKIKVTIPTSNPQTKNKIEDKKSIKKRRKDIDTKTRTELLVDIAGLGRKTSKESQKSTSRRPSKKLSKNNCRKICSSLSIDYGKKRNQSPTILNNDPIKENLNMSPTTAITLMVLATDNAIARKSDFFRKSNEWRGEIEA